MEKFSDFNLDDIFSEKSSAKSPLSNNDNTNIYNNINNSIEYPTAITNLDYYMLSNFIIFEALKKYYTDYKSTIVPYSYIGFYITEIYNYDLMHTPYLKLYLSAFNNKRNNLYDAINIFSKTFPTMVEIKEVKKASFLTGLSAGNYIEVKKKFLDMEIKNEDKTNKFLIEAMNKLKDIATRIDITSKDRKLKLLYIEYLSKKETKTTTTQEVNKQKNTNVKTSTPDTSTQQNEIKPPCLRPGRKRILPPKSEKTGKITSIKLRKLKVSGIYPTSLTHSRIDSAYFAFGFTQGHKTFSLVDNYKFTNAKFTKGFENKRKKLFEQKKSDFDLF